MSKLIFVLVLVLVSQSFSTCYAGNADDGLLIGVWSGGGTASRAIYGTLVITKDRISWQGQTPSSFCKTSYSIVERASSDRYPHMFGEPQPGRTYKLFKLKLGPPECRGNDGGFLFALPSDNAGYAEVVTYGKDGDTTGVVDFVKVR